MMTEANITRLVSKLSQMRGAALKLGQFLSIQDTHVLPPDVDKIFRRVQDSAHYMPDWQMEQVLTAALGPSWSSFFTSFDRIPFAAASIGQVHAATLPRTCPHRREARVAVKVQFPNIASSIASDLGYVSMMLTAGRMLPKGLFLDRTMEVMKQELADECSYTREASFIRAFGAPERLGATKGSRCVPWVWDGSTERVLVMEFVQGIAARIVELCLLELFSFRLMQTDPNYSNFLYNPRLAARPRRKSGTSSTQFMDDWLRLLQAAAEEDRDACVEMSRRVGYLTGEESEVKCSPRTSLRSPSRTPFNPRTPQPFAFGRGSGWEGITQEVRSKIPVMIRERLTPPPRETYSLNR
ncbi:ABC1 family-domain-containing protein [Mycena leptocephala]|nr:ABC1 family-domain-containing protein [Mycena leptocephala]